ncbi:GGDEF domain-containing protein [Pseudoxanthomonas koreensis]|uniref:GGDEF domain-containing protein n=1 Tax=Pseudoxanthomonas koreensis TaxID=266061 RepID=UPI0035A68A56
MNAAGADVPPTPRSHSGHRKSAALTLLAGVALTLGAIAGYDLIPPVRFDVTRVPKDGTVLSSTPVPGRAEAGEWLDDQRRRLRCHYPPGTDDPRYYCAINYFIGAGPDRGVDLSGYTHVEVNVLYKGDVPKLRLFARHFDARYSTVGDNNSTKYNSVFLPTQDLRGPLSLSVDEFTVAEWWRLAYKLPRELAQAELGNVVTVGLDFSYPMTEGVHDLEVKQITFVRPGLSRETWYLGILSVWLAGIVLYALLQLRTYRAERRALQSEAERYRAHATTDPLTLALNRHGLEQVWARLPAGAIPAAGHALALLVLDIDHFKHVNDSCGHDVGDRVLRELAELLRGQLRSTDWLVRWGGEEFVVLLPSVRTGHVATLAENLRKAVEAHAFESGVPAPVTVSVGVALQGPGEDFEALFKRADEALYEAKHQGRNRVVVAAGP